MYYVVINLNAVRPLSDETSGIGFAARPKEVYLSERAATKAAQEMAQKTPKQQVAIFKAYGTIETKTPQFMEKVFTDTGELLPKSKDASSNTGDMLR